LRLNFVRLINVNGFKYNREVEEPTLFVKFVTKITRISKVEFGNFGLKFFVS